MSASPLAKPGQLIHQAFFWLKNSGSADDRAALIAGLQTLAAVPQIQALGISTCAPTEARDVVDHSFDVLETMLFNSLADQASYQTHPIHQAFIAECGHLWERVVVYDALMV